MIRTRSGVLTLALFLLLSGGASSSAPSGAGASGGGQRGDAASTAGRGPRQARVKPAVRLRRDTERVLAGVGVCPTGIEIELWPPNHKYVDIDLAQVLGPDVLQIEIVSITQDEPVDDKGDGHTECDGTGVGTSVARIRSERSGRENGRVYEIEYSAFAGACGGFVLVSVPHDQSGTPAEDDGQLFDSTEGCQ